MDCALQGWSEARARFMSHRQSLQGQTRQKAGGLREMRPGSRIFAQE
jgi:hypothetical protein